MERYKASSDDLSLLTQYADYLVQYNENMNTMEALKNGELNDAELAYYLEVTARINAKLLAAAALYHKNNTTGHP